MWATAEIGANGGVLHHDGSEWNTTEVMADLTPHEIEAIAADDVWLLGNEGSESDRDYCEGDRAAARFDGESWREVASPRVNSALSAAEGEVFAVGWADEGLAADRWNGTEWESIEVAQPDVPAGDNDLDVDPFGDSGFKDVYARSADDVWAVGFLDYEDPTDGPETSYALIGHWDGTQWRVTPHDYPKGFDPSVTGDGEGGLWMAWNEPEKGDSSVLVHQDADGTRTEHPITDTSDGDHSEADIEDLERVPGTTETFAAGEMDRLWDQDWLIPHGRIYQSLQ